MSIELLNELNQEVRRLFVAGGKLAPGDIRLGRLHPSLLKLGESAPVFARVAQAVEQTMDPKTDNPSVRLLDLAALLQSILYTQGQTETKGEPVPLEGAADFKVSFISSRKLSPVIEALTQKGQGRMEVIREAYDEGLFSDYRLLLPAVAALDDHYVEIAEFLEPRIIPSFGADALPVLKDQLRLDGGKGDSRRLKLIHQLQGSSGMTLYLEAARLGSPEVRPSAIELLGNYPEHEPFLLEQAGDSRKEVRQAALLALSTIGSKQASDRIYEAFIKKDMQIAIEPIVHSRDDSLIKRVIDYAATVFDHMKQHPKDKKTIEQLQAALDALHGHRTEGIFELLRTLLQDRTLVIQENARLEDTAARLLVALQTPEAYDLAISLKDIHKSKFIEYSFQAALDSLPPAELYEQFAGYMRGNNTTVRTVLLRQFSYCIPSVYRKMAAEEEAIDAPSMDPRWVDLFIELDEVDHVCRVAQTPDEHTINYLISQCKIDKAGFRYNSRSKVSLLLTLFYIGYDGAAELLVSTMTPEVYKTYYNLNAEHTFLLKQLPGSYAEWVERIAEEASQSEHMRISLLEIAEYIRTKPIER